MSSADIQPAKDSSKPQMAIFAQEESKNAVSKGIGLFSQLLKPGPTTDKRTRDPSKELTGKQLSAIKEFLGMLRRRREDLHMEMQRLTERLNQSQEESITNKLHSEKRKMGCLLILVNMLLFH